MSVATIEPETTTDELAVFRKQDAIVADLREKYMGLTIAGIDDKKGFDAVHAGRMVCKKARVDVEKTREQLKKDILDRGRKIDSEAKRVTALLAPIEEHLESQETAIVNEKERIRREAEEAKKAKLDARMTALQAAEFRGSILVILDMEDAEYNEILAKAQAAKVERDRLAEEERQRQALETERLRKIEAEAAAEKARQEAAEEEERRLESARLAEDRLKIERMRAEIAKQQERLAAEQRVLEAEKETAKRNAELELARRAAAEQAQEDMEQRLAVERAAAKVEEERKAAELSKAEAERPQRERLHIFASRLDALYIAIPDGPGAVAVQKVMTAAVQKIRTIANGPLE